MSERTGSEGDAYRNRIRKRIELDQPLSRAQIAYYTGIDARLVRKLKLPLVPGTKKTFPSDLRYWILRKNGLTDDDCPQELRERIKWAMDVGEKADAWPSPRTLVAALVKANSILRDRVIYLEQEDIVRTRREEQSAWAKRQQRIARMKSRVGE